MNSVRHQAQVKRARSELISCRAPKRTDSKEVDPGLHQGLDRRGGIGVEGASKGHNEGAHAPVSVTRSRRSITGWVCSSSKQAHSCINRLNRKIDSKIDSSDAKLSARIDAKIDLLDAMLSAQIKPLDYRVIKVRVIC